VKEMSFKSGVKTERVIDSENEGGDCDEVMYHRGTSAYSIT